MGDDAAAENSPTCLALLVKTDGEESRLRRGSPPTSSACRPEVRSPVDVLLLASQIDCNPSAVATGDVLLQRATPACSVHLVHVMDTSAVRPLSPPLGDHEMSQKREMIREQTKPVAGRPLNGSISSVCVEETPPTSRPGTLQTTLLVVATSELLPRSFVALPRLALHIRLPACRVDKARCREKLLNREC